MAKVTRHMSVNIEGMLKYFRKKKMGGLIENEGRPLSDKEAREYLAECQKKGWKLLPTGNCPDFDHFRGGCPGHDVHPTSHLNQ